MNDDLNIMKLHNKDGLDVKNIRSNKPQKFKRKLRLDRIAIMLVATGIIAGIANEAIIDNTHESVIHKNDTIEEGSIVHNHDLTNETFVRDYKFVNEDASIDDVQTAIQNGELDFYLKTGKVKYMKSLQDEKSVSDIDYYNKNTLSFYQKYNLNTNKTEITSNEHEGMTIVQHLPAAGSGEEMRIEYIENEEKGMRK